MSSENHKNKIVFLYNLVIAGFIIVFFTQAWFSLKFLFMIFLGITVLIAGLYIMNAFRKRISIGVKYKKLILPVLLFAVFISRLGYALYAATRVHQVSDFQIAINEVRSGIFVDQGMYYLVAPYKMIYPFVLHKLGFSGNQEPLLTLQAIFAVITALGIYLVTREICDENTSFLAVILYLIYPSQLLYTSIFTEEHLAASVTVFIVFFLLRIIKIAKCSDEVQANRKKLMMQIILLSALTGILGGILVILKDWGGILLIAFVLIWPIACQRSIRRFLYLMVALLIVLVTRSFVSGVSLQVVADYVGGITPDNGIYAHMYASLIPGETISHNEERFSEYVDMFVANEYDVDKTHAMVRQELKRRISENPMGFVKLFLQKISRSYIGGDLETIEWVFQEYSTDWRKTHVGIYNMIQEINYYYYAAFVLLIILGIAISNDVGGIFIGLILAGAMSSQLFIEAQGRYKYSIQSLWCVLAAVGICYAYSLLQRRNYKIEKASK